MNRQDQIERLIRRLSHKREAVRSSAAITLATMRAREAVGALVAKLADPSHEVRKAVAQALISIGDASALPGLMEHVESSDQALRCWSAAVVRKLSGEDFGFSDNATFDSIERAIPGIRAWWKRKSRTFRGKE